MKKALSLILALVLCLSLCACGKNEAVISCEEQIENIGSITLDSNYLIENARNAYDRLAEKEQRKVGNYDKLIDAEAEYERLVGELNAQIETMLADEPGKKTLDALRQLPDCLVVRKAIAFAAQEMLSAAIHEKGYQDSDAYYWVVGSYTFQVDEEYLRVSAENSKPRVSAKSAFQFYKSESTLFFFEDGGSFYRSDMFKYRDDDNHIDVVSASWSTSIPNTITKKTFSEYYGMDVRAVSDNKPWPYTASEDSLDDQFDKTTDALNMLEELTDVLRKQELPFSAWELVGICDPDMR